MSEAMDAFLKKMQPEMDKFEDLLEKHTLEFMLGFEERSNKGEFSAREQLSLIMWTASVFFNRGLFVTQDLIGKDPETIPKIVRGFMLQLKNTADEAGVEFEGEVIRASDLSPGPMPAQAMAEAECNCPNCVARRRRMAN